MNIKNKLKKAKRIVVKIGTNTLSTKDGKMALSRIYGFIEDIAELKNQGKEVIMVTSGAVGFGAKKLNIPKPDVSIITASTT